jgi:chorismate synthase
MRVAAAVIAKKWLAEHSASRAWLSRADRRRRAAFDWNVVEQNPFFWPDAAMVEELENTVNALRKSGDSVGARVVVADGVPPGWGEPIYGKLDGDLAAALMSINAVKGVEIGDGFAAVAQKGSEHRDEMTPDGFLSNHAGGILGGISSGQAVFASIALKPTSSILIPARSVNLEGADRSRHQRPPRSLRRHPRHADRRSDGRARAHGSRAAPPRAMRRRRHRAAADSGLRRARVR